MEPSLIAIQEQFPLVQRQWDNVTQFRTQIAHKATLSLREREITSQVRGYDIRLSMSLICSGTSHVGRVRIVTLIAFAGFTALDGLARRFSETAFPNTSDVACSRCCVF